MCVKLFRCLFMAAAFNALIAAGAAADIEGALSRHREAVDVSAYPWSAIGKLANEAGGTCTGVIIARDKILTAAHCVYSDRTRRFLPASSLHFLAGYRSGRVTVHARVASYEIGSGYDPLRWFETVDADFAILTLTEKLPVEIAPLKLLSEASPSGTKATIAGYPQDRAHMMTADRDCELRERDGAGRYLIHTCRGIRGYSGAPILVSMPGDEFRIAGIHVATAHSNGTKKMIAVSAQSIFRDSDTEASPETTASIAPESDRLLQAFLAVPVDSGWFE